MPRKSILRLSYFKIKFKKRILKFSKHRIFARDSVSLHWFLANAINRRKKREKKGCEFRLPVKLLSPSFCHFFVSLPPPLEERCFFFFNPENVPRRGKE